MAKNIWRGRPMDEVKITTHIEATDQLGTLVRRIQVESPRKGDLRKQAAAIVEKVTYLGWELKVIEVDGAFDASIEIVSPFFNSVSSSFLSRILSSFTNTLINRFTVLLSSRTRSPKPLNCESIF